MASRLSCLSRPFAAFVIQAFAQFLDAQPPEVQEAFQFPLPTAMHEAGSSELVNVAEVDGWWYYILSGAGEVFSVAI